MEFINLIRNNLDVIIVVTGIIGTAYVTRDNVKKNTNDISSLEKKVDSIKTDTEKDLRDFRGELVTDITNHKKNIYEKFDDHRNYVAKSFSDMNGDIKQLNARVDTNHSELTKSNGEIKNGMTRITTILELMAENVGIKISKGAGNNPQ